MSGCGDSLREHLLQIGCIRSLVLAGQRLPDCLIGSAMQ